MTAAAAIDTSDLSTQEAVDAARAAIVALRGAIDAAVDVADTSMYESQLAAATMDVDEAQGGIDTATRRTNQMAALSGASDTLQAALAALSGSTPTQAQLDAANAAVTGLNDAITAGADLTDAEKATYVREAANAAAPIQTAEMAKDDADAEAEKTAAAAMAATAAKLILGIAAPSGDLTSPAQTDRAAAYTGTNDSQILVSIGDGTTAPTAPATGLHTLAEDKKTTVVALHGWEGKRYADPAGGDMVEAVVYSKRVEPVPGAKFNVAYTLASTATATVLVGEVGIDQSDTAHPTSRVASPSFDQSAGVKEFEKGDNQTRVMISGTYYGVSGTYYCTPAAVSTCAVNVAARGFTLGGTLDATNAFTAGGGTWAFKPANPEAKVTNAPAANYASYGWWLRKSEGGKYTASAFADDRGTYPVASGITDLQGTATYQGGAAGKYALSSSTGGTNDAGHFTARATLEADFSENVSATGITGTIDQFVGADGESRDWEVELMGSAISAGGLIRALNVDGTTEPVAADAGAMTKWTIDGAAAKASGEWSGTLYNNGADGVPRVATGIFFTQYGDDGRMVGAFGVDKQ